MRLVPTAQCRVVCRRRAYSNGTVVTRTCLATCWGVEDTLGLQRRISSTEHIRNRRQVLALVSRLSKIYYTMTECLFGRTIEIFIMFLILLKKQMMMMMVVFS